MKPNRENTKKWVEALRTGGYAQAQGYLLDSNTAGYCCLGVACDLFLKEEGIKEDRFDPDYWRKRWPSLDAGLANTLPPEVAEWLGLASPDKDSLNENPLVGGRPLSGINDQGGSFEQIADLIEAEYLPGGGAPV